MFDEETNDFIMPSPCRFQQWRVAGIVSLLTFGRIVQFRSGFE